jgi:hypothetical protein
VSYRPKTSFKAFWNLEAKNEEVHQEYSTPEVLTG